MADPREPGDQGRPSFSDDEQRLRASMANELPPRRPEMEVDDDLYGMHKRPSMAEGEASYGRIALYAVVALLVVSAVLYGMGHNGGTMIAQRGPGSVADNANPAPPPVRNVTPGPNSQSGTTTGAAPTNPAPASNPPSPAPAGTGAR